MDQVDKTSCYIVADTRYGFALVDASRTEYNHSTADDGCTEMYKRLLAMQRLRYLVFITGVSL